MPRILPVFLSALLVALPLAAQAPEPDPAKLPVKPAEEPIQVSGALVLIGYKDSPKPIPTATRTKEEAKARAEEAMNAARAMGANFDDIVAKYSDDPGNKGRVGVLARGQCSLPPLEEALFGMGEGQVSDVIECDYGFIVATRLVVRSAAHVLLMYVGSQGAGPNVTRTKDEA
ncbi:MAG: peptidylprolyl isomerase, partial [Planctomycetota bacterium]